MKTWVPALALAALQTVLLVQTAWDKSETIDESTYIGRAAHQWNGAFSCSPALPQWGFALALRAVDPSVEDVPADPRTFTGRAAMLWSRSAADLRRNLHAARLATIAVVVLGGLLLRAAARRFGEGPALATHALWCFSPLVLAHGALAALDGWVAALLCAVIWSGVRLFDRPTASRAAAAGACAALAASCKLTALGVVPALLAIPVFALQRDAERTWLRPALGLAGVGTAAFLVVLWGVYGFRLAVPGNDDMCPQAIGLWPGPRWPVPFPEWIDGALVQLRHGYVRGHLSYLFGEISERGWWWFYLASLALQTTLAAQALFLLRVAAAAVAPPPQRDLAVDLALLSFPLLLLVLLSAGRTQNGIRYLLPLYPFTMLCGGRALRDVDRLCAGRRRWARAGRAAVFAAIGLGAVSALSVHPHHLMYFNAWAGGPDGGPRYLVHGSDWGQDLRRLGEWQKAHDVRSLYFLPYDGRHEYLEVPPKWGVEYELPGCNAPVPGVYALHALLVHRPWPHTAGCLDWLTLEPPDEKIGYSIYIYRVDGARLQRLARERGRITPFVETARWRRRDPPQAF